ncbi:MAG: hypothetical protein IJS61_03970 [Firmicutes bacterium]|nr:hypothetical protein [Bacillota bacterium]
MKILLFGISNVGKTTTGEILAKRLGFKFYDLDEEVKKHFKITIEEFVHTADLRWRDEQRESIINKLIRSKENTVITVTPISYPKKLETIVKSDDILAIELYDTPENIFSRLVFSDENDIAYTDDPYKNRYKEYYLKEIQEDLNWYGSIYATLGITNRIFINNATPEKLIDRIISEYNLEKYL